MDTKISQKAPELYAKTVKPLILGSTNQDLSDEDISLVVDWYWNQASHDVRMLFLKPVIE